MKRVYIVITVILALIAIFAAWTIFNRGDAPLTERVGDALPFGSGEGVSGPTTDNQQLTTREEAIDNISAETKLFRLVNTPVAGFVPLLRATTTVVRYTDRATGHISDVALPTLERTKITNKTLPKIYEAHFRRDGLGVLYRSLLSDSDETGSLSLVLTPPRGTSTNPLYTISATSLRGELDSITPGVGDTLYYVLKNNSAIVSSTFNGANLRTILSSDFTSWRLGRLGNNLLAYTKASADATGYAYNLSIGGALTKILGPLNGLIAVGNNNGTRVLYSYYEAGETRLFVKNLQNNTSLEIRPASIAEKCAWSSKEVNRLFCGMPISDIAGEEPDSWYAGKSHFSDYIWSFDTDSEIAQLVTNPKSDFGIDLDVSEPQVSSDGNYLIFINRNDLTLWAVKLQ